MTSKVFTTVDASEFLSDLNKGSIRDDLRHDAYGHTYRALIKLASASNDDSNCDAALSLACAVYGWMPTIFKGGEKIRELGPAFSLEKVRSIKSWEEAKTFLSEVSDFAPINNSWVGTSKFLHFLNPDIFPIWDSRVAVSFHSKISIEAKRTTEQGGKLRPLQLNYFCNNKDNYLKYSEFMIDSLKAPIEWIDLMQEETQIKYKYLPTRLRCLELSFFNRYSRTLRL